MGGGTLLLSLPREWVKRNGLKKGSVLAVEEMVSGYLAVRPFRGEERPLQEIEIGYPAEYGQLLVNEITGAYLLGYDVLRIRGKDRISYEDTEVIKQAVRQLVGLEIVEEDAYSITLQFLLQTTTLEPEKTFRRMNLITLGMHQDAMTAWLEGDRRLLKVVRERDDEVDRLYFLLVRLIRTAIRDAHVAQRFGWTPIDCLDYRVAANIVESIGDAAVDLAAGVEALVTHRLKPEAKDALRAIGEGLGSMQDAAIRAFLTRSVKGAREVVRLFGSLKEAMQRAEHAVPEELSGELGPFLASMAAVDKICRGLIDIADLAVPMYPIVR